MHVNNRCFLCFYVKHSVAICDVTHVRTVSDYGALRSTGIMDGFTMLKFHTDHDLPIAIGRPGWLPVPTVLTVDVLCSLVLCCVLYVVGANRCQY